MKKSCFIYIFLLFFLFFGSKKVVASEVKNLNIHIDGQVPIDSECNGVCFDYNIAKIQIDDLTCKVENKASSRIFVFENFNEGEDGELIYSEQIDGLSSNSNLTISLKLTAIYQNSELLQRNFNFEKNIEVKNITKNFESSDVLNVYIFKEEIKNLVSYDVIFKCEEGGSFAFDENYIGYTGLIPGQEFVTIPEVYSEGENSFFDYWFDENNNQIIEDFPKTIEGDYSYVARWKIKNEQKLLDKKTSNLQKNREISKFLLLSKNTIEYSDNPNSSKENRVFNRILEYIIKSNILV